MSEEKSARRERLFYSQKHGYDLISDAERADCDAYCEGYKRFLDAARTEREAVKAAVALAEAEGFVPYVRGMALRPGLRIYQNNRGKTLSLAVIGEKSLAEGAVITAAHIDAPRLDLKPNPLYEDSELAYFKTHYYGGIRKYQWAAIPLELHGAVALRGGETLDVCIGADENDPAFVITDLLPHLAADQNKKTLGEAITGENLNLLIGSIPDQEEGADRVKLRVLSILNEKYGVTEEDFLSAELEVVPSLPTRDIGLDRSLLGGYGHDDRVCSYAALKALLDTPHPGRTAVCVLADKEEIGSYGSSGMGSEFFENFMADLCRTQNVELRHCFEKSFCFSSDVCNAFDPNFPEVSEKRNNARLNYGVSVVKYTGSRGKGGANDANAETLGYLRKVFAAHGVVWQSGELGKVDQGGGGTVATELACRNIETVDAGVPVLAMHSPYEVVAKFDCYMTYKAMKAIAL
ncbi:MAG: aminopeptidase [Firmicutes bacterium]|nr:aminopeptidase [Bacillota bacterium]